MKVTVAGLGLIGGSFLKAAQAAGYEAHGCHHGETTDLGDTDIIIVAQPPQAIEPWIRRNESTFKEGAIVVDVCGVKGHLYDAFRLECLHKPWHFVPAHPMAGREVGGFENSTPDLFNGASMILTPFPYTGRGALDALEKFFRALGFARVVLTTPEHHDEMIAYTSQLCHMISSAYVREPLSAQAEGYSAGSFRDMVRVGAPDPDVWTELFLLNRGNLIQVLERYIARLESFRDALQSGDAASLKRDLAEGAAAKRTMARDSQDCKKML